MTTNQQLPPTDPTTDPTTDPISDPITPAPQAGRRRLVRPRTDRMLGGVCAGTARYLDVDVTVVRLVLVASCLLGFAGVVLYVAGLLLMPEE